MRISGLHVQSLYVWVNGIWFYRFLVPIMCKEEETSMYNEANVDYNEQVMGEPKGIEPRETLERLW